MTRVPAVVLMSIVSTLFGGTAHRKSEQGNEHYRQERHEEALQSYTEAQVAAPDAPELHYDVGNVLYRQQKFGDAAEAYQRALGSAAAELAPTVSYNLGNAFFRDERYREAVDAYRRTLRAEPGDLDAKRNLELALRALEEQRQQRPQQQQQRQQQQQQEQQQQQQEQQQQQQQEQQQQGQNREENSPGEMTPEQARRLLDRLREEETENLRRQAERRGRPVAGGREKTW